MSRSVRAGVVAAIITELFYGCSYVFTKDITSTVSPVTLLAWRFGVALVVLLVSVTLAGVVTTVVAPGVTLGTQTVGYVPWPWPWSFALYTVIAERYAQASDLEKTFVMIAAGALVFCTMAITGHASAGSLGSFVSLPITRPDFAYLALGCTIGAFFLQHYAISSIGSNRFSTFTGVETVAALVTGAAFLGERLSVVQLLGGAAILVSFPTLTQWPATDTGRLGIAQTSDEPLGVVNG